MERIKVEVSWCDKNFCCGYGHPSIGAVMTTAKRLDDLQRQFERDLRSHIVAVANDGDDVPQWMMSGDYDIVYSLDAAALIRTAEEYASITAISKASGINAKQLSHYANNVKKPRPLQRRKVVEGLHDIARHLENIANGCQF